MVDAHPLHFRISSTRTESKIDRLDYFRTAVQLERRRHPGGLSVVSGRAPVCSPHPHHTYTPGCLWIGRGDRVVEKTGNVFSAVSRLFVVGEREGVFFGGASGAVFRGGERRCLVACSVRRPSFRGAYPLPVRY